MDKLIITVALVGGITTRDKTPYPPMTPRELAESAVESYHAGAAACHVHVRDPRTHALSMEFELYREVYDRIREKCDMVINLSTGSGGRLLYDAQANLWNTSDLKSAELNSLPFRTPNSTQSFSDGRAQAAFSLRKDLVVGLGVLSPDSKSS